MKFEPTDITRIICELEEDTQFLTSYMVWSNPDEYDRKGIGNTVLHIDKAITALDTLPKILYTVK